MSLTLVTEMSTKYCSSFVEDKLSLTLEHLLTWYEVFSFLNQICGKGDLDIWMFTYNFLRASDDILPPLIFLYI